MTSPARTATKVPICSPKSLPPHLLLHAAHAAVAHNEANRPMMAMQALVAPTPEQIAVVTGKRWKTGTTLTVNFTEPIDPGLRNLILSHMSAWSSKVNISFAYSTADPVVRVTLDGDGYWSYIGTDLLSIPANEPTMSLQGWSTRMPDSECRRVIRHETGHTLGSVHEHARPEIVALLDPAKTTAYFEATQGWSADMIRQQILTPLDESTLMGTTPNEDSIMCYQFPGDVTISGDPIPGGADITADDMAFLASVYPGRGTPTPPVPVPVPPPTAPPPGGGIPIAVGGPAVAAVVGPGAPLVLAAPLAGGSRTLLTLAMAGRSLFSSFRPAVSVVIVGPSGRSTPVPLRSGKAEIRTAATGAGTYTITVSSALPHALAVTLSSG